MYQLVLREKTAKGAVFVDPATLRDQVSFITDRRTRKIGKIPQTVVRNEISVVHEDPVDQCGECENQQPLYGTESGRLIISVSSPEKFTAVLNDLIANARKLITESPATLKGLPVAMNYNGVTTRNETPTL